MISALLLSLGTCAQVLAQIPPDDAAPYDAESPDESGAPQSASVDAAPGTDAGSDGQQPPLAVIPVAQVRTAPEPESAPEPSEQVLDDIVVTATKRPQSLRKIPSSISAVDGKSLEASGAGELQDYIDQVVGITQNRSAQPSSRIAVRGVGFETMPGAATLQTTGILINDAAFNDPFINSLTVDVHAFDLQSVEVLKGPQGTLFGAAALGGAVRYVLAEPVTGIWEGKTFLQYTSKEEGGSDFAYGVTANVPLWDSVDHALRLTWIDRNVPGVYDDLRFDQKDADESRITNLRAQYLWDGKPYRVKLLYLTQGWDGYGVGFADNTQGRLSYANQQVPRERLPAPTDFALTSLELAYEFDTVRLGSYTHHTHKQTDTTVDLTRQFGVNPPPEQEPAILFHVIQDIDGFTQEFRLQSTEGDRLNWLVGAYGFLYDHYSFVDLYSDALGPDTGPTDIFIPGIGAIENPTALGTSGTLLVGTYPADARELALFGEASYRLWKRLELTAGLRLFQTRVEGGTRDSRGLLIAALNNGMELNATNEIEEQGVSPKLAFLFELDERTSFYGNVAKGFRFGGVQLVPTTTGTSQAPPTYKSDTLWNYEVGVRNTLFERVMHIDLAAFYMDWQDPQIQQRDPTTSINFTTNASGARIYGGELAFQYVLPIPGLRLTAAASYTRAQISETFVDGNGVTIPDGTPLPGTPEWQANAGIHYDTAFGNNWSLLGDLNYSYASEAYSTLTREVPILDYSLLNANLGVGRLDWPGTPRVTLSVFNVLDERAVTNAWYTDGDPEPAIDTWYLPTRTLNVKLDLSF
ncbi:MAG: TonB-dependent receptor [Sinimarinibacterium sp.]|jgi:outer membrane receptor protein involved in Fe transport